MTGGGLPGIYVMDQMHFHWASEHTINEERYKTIKYIRIYGISVVVIVIYIFQVWLGVAHCFA